MNTNKKISILGCGWLGLPLAIELNNKGYKIKGSTTSPHKLDELKACQIDPFLVHFGSDTVPDVMTSFLSSETLILTIPPKKEPDRYLSHLRELINLIPETEIKHVIFISSTSVYGNEKRELNELDVTSPETDSGLAILEGERLFMNNSHFKTAVVRMAGLTGPGRDPARFMAGKENVPNGKAPVNLIHLDDCIGIIRTIIEKGAYGEVYNAVCPHHPTREEFYTLAAQTSELAKPTFVNELNDWKIISSLNVPGILNYDFKIQGWLSWLRAREVL